MREDLDKESNHHYEARKSFTSGRKDEVPETSSVVHHWDRSEFYLILKIANINH